MTTALLVTLGLLALAQTTPAPAKPQPSPQPAAAAQPAPAPYHVITTFDVGGEGGWDYVTIDPDANRLYVPRSTRVLVLDAQTGKSVGEIADTAGVHGVALAPEFNKGFTSNGRAGNATVFDTRTLKTIQTVKTGDNPDALLYDPATKHVFIFNGRSKDATVIDASALSVVATIPLGGKPEAGVSDGKGKVFVNIEDTGEIVQIDTTKNTVDHRWSLSPGTEPTGLAIDTANHRLFAGCGNQMMVIVDTQSGKVLASPPIGKGVDGTAFDAAKGYALSSNGEGTLSVISGDKDNSFSVVQTLPTAPRARTLTIDPKTRRIYLPTAEFEPQKEGDTARPAMKPGTFKIVVVGP